MNHEAAFWLGAAGLVPALALMCTAELRGDRRLYGYAKITGSLIFVFAAAIALPRDRAWTWLLCSGFVLSALGDALLVPKGRRLAFLAGLGAFLSAHAMYGLAFVARGIDTLSVFIAATALVIAGTPLSRWLLPHVKGGMRGPVLAYIVVITAMVALAAGTVGAHGQPLFIVGAFVFYLSDLCVARERFVAKSPWNGVVGLPLYYAAQMLLIAAALAPST